VAVPGLPTRGPHVFVEALGAGDRTVLLKGAEAHHLATVLRARAGTAVSVADGQGSVWQAEVSAVRDGAVELALGARHTLAPPRPRARVVVALPKGRNLDEVVQRLVELGVDRIVPAESARSVHLDPSRRAKAVRRWQAVARAAAKQSRRAWLAEVAPVTTWADALADAPAGAVLWEQAEAPLGTVLSAQVGGTTEVTLAVGPEGGLDAAEVRAAGLPTAALGATILRAETAAVVGAALLLHHVGRLG
jgi:16S rRNA (uracil1498-N3)-methyltransferase